MVMWCTQCDQAMELVQSVDLEGEFKDHFDEDGKLQGEVIEIANSTIHEFWQCSRCGAKWPA